MTISLLYIILVPLLSPLTIGIIRKVKACLQNRRGAPVLQLYRDIRKLFHKDEVVSKDASWIFFIAPYILFATTLLVAASLPLFGWHETFFGGDFLVVIYLFALCNFFLALAGMDTGSPFGGFGSSREMTVAALSEAGLLFAFLTPALISGNTDIAAMTSGLAALPVAQWILILIASIGFFIVFLAENARYPFDNPATHLELTMIHEAMILEYSGKRLALVEWAAANKLFLFAGLGVTLFWPVALPAVISFGSIVIGILLFLVKILIVVVGIGLLESSMAKIRFFRIPDLLFTSLIIGIIALLIAIF